MKWINKKCLQLLFVLAIFIILKLVLKEPLCIWESTRNNAEQNVESIVLSQQVDLGTLVLIDSKHLVTASDWAISPIVFEESIDCTIGEEHMSLSHILMAPLNEMLKDCNEDIKEGTLIIKSAFRSESTQASLYKQIIDEEGESGKTLVAYPGSSEHQTGLAIDFGIGYDNGLEGTFSQSSKSQWLKEHAADYGFIIRYTEDSENLTGIRSEPWHYRYVGMPHARIIEESGMVLETYLDYVQRFSQDRPLLYVEGSGDVYQVFYCKELTDQIKEDARSISGDNIGGYIVTVLL